MRICLVGTPTVPIPPARGGGTEEFLRILAKGLREKGHEVSIVCGMVGDRSQLEGVKFYRVRPFKLLGPRICEILYGLEILFFLLVRAKRFDLIHFHSFFDAFFSSAFNFLVRKPMIFTSHCPYPWDLEYEQIRRISKVVLKLRGHMKRRMNRVVVSSHKVGENVLKYTKMKSNKLRVIYEAIDSTVFSPTYGKGMRAFLGLDDEDFVVLFAGRLTESKGVEYLLRAVPLVVREIATVKFVMVGSESFTSDKIPSRLTNLCKRLDIEDRVVFVGRINHESLAKIYCSADIFVLPSIWENFGLVVAEAMLSGLPVVATDVADIPLWLNECGIIVRKRDEFDLAEAIIRLAKDKQLRERYSKRAIEVAKIFSVEKFINDYEQVYIECLGEE